MRLPDHFDAGEETETLYACDRCTQRETTEGEFVACEDCGETLCPEHFAEGDLAPTADTCARCVEKARDHAAARQWRQQFNS